MSSQASLSGTGASDASSVGSFDGMPTPREEPVVPARRRFQRSLPGQDVAQTPVAVIEAGAARKPAVATRVGGVADVVQDGKTGILVPPGDPRAVAAGISALLEDPGRARALGEAAHSEVGSRFTIERLADDLAGLYGELLARKTSRTRS